MAWQPLAARQPSVKFGEFPSSMLKLTMRDISAAPKGQRPEWRPPRILPLNPADGGALRFQLPLDSETTAINDLLGRGKSKTMPATDFFDLQSYPSLSDPVPMSIASTAGHVTIHRRASDSQNAVLELDRQASDSLVGLRLRPRYRCRVGGLLLRKPFADVAGRRAARSGTSDAPAAPDPGPGARVAGDAAADAREEFGPLGAGRGETLRRRVQALL